MPTRRPTKPKLNPVQRIRDAVRYVRPQQNISYQEWKEIDNRAKEAEIFMSENNFIYKMMMSDLEEAKNIILENRIREVHEEAVVTTKVETTEQGGVSVIPEIVKRFITPRKIQVDELVGQYKWLKGFFAEMKTWIDFRDELVRKEADGQLTIERNERAEI